ncbi:hypothetical protein [Lichenicoccus sp.]|uniref:hypothetical protein n=1 Tax=Lichenicoccus sp. TaxID=2781899 RepID=UPI003D0FC3FD
MKGWPVVAAIALMLPGAITASLLPALLGHPPGRLGLRLWRAALALPILVTPILAALRQVQAGQARAATGLGAGRFDRLRWIWLPQLGPGLAASLLLALLLAAAAFLARG